MCKCKKILKALAVIAAIAGALVAIYFVITKMLEKKNAADDEEDYVSCSCCDEEPVVADATGQA